MDDRSFEQLMRDASIGEMRNIEFKGPGAWSSSNFALRSKTIRAILGMANLRDRGYIVIGVDESSTRSPVFLGLSLEDRQSWNHDHVASVVANYADPGVDFLISPQKYDGVDLILITVEEFNDVPVICKQDYGNVLRKGACYVRPRGQVQTVEVPSQTEMRELIDIATAKALAHMLATVEEADGKVVSRDSMDRRHSDLFQAELGGL